MKFQISRRIASRDSTRGLSRLAGEPIEELCCRLGRTVWVDENCAFWQMCIHALLLVPDV
jgi:hypothetical protein